MKHYIAIDWGATSGRVIVAHDDGSHIELEEVHRFPNAIHHADDSHFYWDFSKLLEETFCGLSKAARLGVHYQSIGVDTWGVDVVFLDNNGRMLAQPIAYRDTYTEGIPQEVFAHIPAQELYQLTGIQTLNFNTIFQLYACHKEHFSPFEKSAHILFIPDAINYFLSGQMVCEYSALSTSGLLNPRTKEIETSLLPLCGLRREQFPKIVNSGYDLGTILPSVAERTGLNDDCRVIAVAGHDTASAVAACPRVIDNKHAAYLSCGTWSLMGIVTDEPVINNLSFQLNFTNEGGVNGTTRLLKNITGMWILEQCRKEWAEQGKDYTYSQLVEMAQSVTSAPVFNPDEQRFANPQSMLEEVRNGEPLTDAQVAWSIYHSLAHRYAEVFNMLRSLAPWPIEVLYVIGGGAKNSYLIQLTQEAIGLPVIAGPTEATALGNILEQRTRNKE